MHRLLALALLGACAKPPPPVAAPVDRGIQHPDLPCAEGTVGRGAAPPAGTEIFCARVDSSGTVTRQGPVIAWHSASRRAYAGAYADDQKAGRWTYWHVSGALDEEGSYSADKKDGAWVMYHPNGRKAAEGSFVAGKEEGPWVFYNEDHSRISRGTYVAGGRDGLWIDYDPQDRPVRERSYRNGRVVTQRELLVE